MSLEFIKKNITRQGGEEKHSMDERVEYISHAQKFVGYEKASMYSIIYRNKKELGCEYSPILMKNVKKYTPKKLKN